MATAIIMPEMGEGIIEGTVVRWLKSEGDTVQRDEPVLEIETDKVNVEVTAQTDGTLLKINAAEGDTLPVGTVLAHIGAPGETVEEDSTIPAHAHAAREPAAQTSAPQTAQPAPSTEKATGREFDGVRVSPVVARMVQEHDIDVHALSGSGRDGRITKQDVLDYLETADSPAPAHPAAPIAAANGDHRESGDALMPLTGMRRAIAEHMVRSVQTSPHATTVFEFDFSAVTEHRNAHKAAFEKQGVKLTYLAYLAVATVAALKAHKLVNASWTDDGILLKRDVNLGIAVAMSKGLVVPVIRHAEHLNLLGMASAIQDVAERARDNALSPDDMRGGTFTITNHGVAGSLFATPIINQPQVGILGFGVIEKRVKVIDDMIALRPCAYISFSFDHRVLDGATADGFVAAVKAGIENFT